MLSTNVFYLSSLAKVVLPTPNITYSRFAQSSPTQVSFVVTSNQVAPYVFLQTSIAGVFSDNGFLLLPNTPVAVLFNAKQAVKVDVLQASLTVKSVAMTY